MVPTLPPRRKRMRRYERPDQVRFLTSSTFGRLPLFKNDRIKDLFATRLSEAKRGFRFHLYAWVVMPEHVHLLLWPLLPELPVSAVLRQFKRDFASEVIERWRVLNAPILARISARDGRPHFWLPGGGYDRNISSVRTVADKARYINLNPVRRGLCGVPEAWGWSSARWYAGDRSGPVELDPLPPKRPGSAEGRTPAGPEAGW